jgi:DNA-binding transcriptional regulator YbjK
VPSRQEALLDGAIDVLGSRGVRGLTHRAVDAAAGLPAGSASNYFKTRQALLSAVVERFAERERVAWETIVGFIQPRTADELAVALAAYVRRATGPDRAMTVARYSLFVEAAVRTELQPRLAETAREIHRWGVRWLQAVGSADPDKHCRLILDQLEGIILHELALPDPDRDLDATMAAVVGALT